MYIVKKKISGRDYYYIRKSVRKGDKVKSNLVCYGGKTLEIAEKKLKELKMQKEQKENNKNIGVNKIIMDNKIDDIKNVKSLTIDELAQFCKRKGFIFRSSDIYGGFSGFWDFWPLGVELFNNIKKEWWNYFVKQREDIVGMEASIISHPLTWKASGHLQNFSDIAVLCKKCGKATKIEKNEIGRIKCE